METHEASETRFRERIRLADELQAEAKGLSCVADTFEVAEALLEQLPLCVALPDGNGLPFASRRLAEVLGHSRQSLREITFDDLMSPHDAAAMREEIHKVKAGELPRIVVTRCRVRGTGRWVALRWRWQPQPGRLCVALVEVLGDGLQLID